MCISLGEIWFFYHSANSKKIVLLHTYSEMNRWAGWMSSDFSLRDGEMARTIGTCHARVMTQNLHKNVGHGGLLV